MSPKHNKRLNEAGFASIVIALILIIVLALLTVGFATLARREQQNALSKQLSLQANDAAESGINDAYQAIRKDGTIYDADGVTVDPNLNTNKCLSGPPWQNHTLGDSQHIISYSCVIANVQPPELDKGPLNPNSGWTTVFATKLPGGAATNPLKSLDINWSTADGQTANPSTPGQAPSGFTPSGFGFTPAGNWAFPAVLQFSITPLANDNITPLANNDRASLIANTFTAYLYPSSAGSSLVYDPQPVNGVPTHVPIVTGGCSAGKCKVTLSGLDTGSNPGRQYLIHFLDYYDASNIKINHATDGTNPLVFTNSQATIDVTGKAKNVLKRLRETLPITPAPSLPSYGIEAQDICKRFTTDPVANTVIDPTLSSYPGCSFP